MTDLGNQRTTLENISRDTDTLSRRSMAEVGRGSSETIRCDPRTPESLKATEGICPVSAAWRWELAWEPRLSSRDKTRGRLIREQGMDGGCGDIPDMKISKSLRDFPSGGGGRKGWG